MEPNRPNTRPSPLSSLLEVQALRKLEALQRWMEATDARPDMQRLLTDAIEDLRDAALRAVVDGQAVEGVGMSSGVQARSLPVEPLPLPDSDELFFDEGPRTLEPRMLEPACQAFTFQTGGEMPQALWQEGFSRSSAPLPVLVDELEMPLRRRPPPEGPLLGRVDARSMRRERAAEVLELSASESGVIDSAVFVSIQGLEPGDVVTGPSDHEAAWVRTGLTEESPRQGSSAGRSTHPEPVSFWFGARQTGPA